jgi:methionine-gamma-lyase
MVSTETKSKLSLREATIAVHGGELREEQPFGAVVSPVFHSSTFGFRSFDEMRRYSQGELSEAYFYSRYANPTVAEVERKLAELEHAEACVVTSSGSAATFCALAALCEAGDEIIACDSVYGGSVKLMTEVLSRWGVQRTAPSLGGVETLVSYPLYSSHVGFSQEQLRVAGVSAATVRFAIGIEAAEDIIDDIQQALEKI